MRGLAGRRQALLWFLILAIASPAAAAPGECRADDNAYSVDVWSVEQGLPQSTVTSIAQTRDGYLWVGTLGGLARFDGHRFRVFGSRDGLQSPRISALHVARDGALWIGTEGAGVVRYASGSFTTFSRAHGLSHDVISHIVEDRSGRIWVSALSGLNVWQNGMFTSVSTADGNTSMAVLGLAPDSNGGVWMSMPNQVCRTDGGPLVCTTLAGATALLQRGPDELWVASTTRGVLRRRGKRVEPIPGCDRPGCLSGAEMLAIRQTITGDVWIATDGGLDRWRDGRLTQHSVRTTLPTTRLRTLYDDEEGNIWAGTSDAGLLRLKLHRVTTCSAAHGLAQKVVTTVAEDAAGTMWVGSDCGGLRTIRDGRVAAVTTGPPAVVQCVFSLAPARDGGMWMGSWAGGLLKRTGTAMRTYTSQDGLSDDVVLSLHEDQTGGVWVGTYSGGLDYLKDGSITNFTARDGLAGTFLTSIVEQRDGTIWVASNGGGLTRIANGKLTPFRRDDGLGSHALRTLFVDRDDTLWVGTTDAGLLRLVNGAFVRYDSTRGLADDSVSQILEDADGNLWIGSGRGISRLLRAELDAVAQGRQSSLQVLTLGQGDGLLRTEAVGDHSPTAWKARDGRLWFATYGGLAIVDPARLRLNTRPPPVTIESVTIDGSAIAVTPTVRVAPDTRMIQIQFTALSLVDAARNQFRYRLDGWDSDWVQAGTRRDAEYGRLPPGTYEFTVAASNNDGLWNTTGARVQLVFEPYIWERWWFRFAAMLLVVGGLTLGLRSVALARITRRMEAFERENALNRERARIARDMHDELGARLTTVALLADTAVSPTQVQRVSDAVRQAVRAMDETVWTINPRNDSLENFASYASKYATEFLTAASIHCRLDLPLSLPPFVLSAADRHSLLMVVKEALTNVVRHAQATEVRFRLHLVATGLTIQVTDNGRGLSAPSASTHRSGLANMRHRVEGLGGTLDVQSGSSGTVVTIVLFLNERGHTNR